MNGVTIRCGAGLLLAFGLLSTIVTEAARPPAALSPSQADSIAGKLLVATADLDDPNFYHTIVYMVRHDDTGAMGLVINRRLGRGPIGKLLEGLGLDPGPDGTAEIDVHYGGPVQSERGFTLHSPDYQGADTVVLSKSLALTSSFDVLSAIAAGKGPDHSLFAFGYAGWGANQLERELAAGAWVVVDADEALLFDPQLDTKWQRALDLRGFDL